MKKPVVIISMLVWVIILGACTEEKKSLNPNGDSELALLMRQMYDESLAISKSIKNGSHDVAVDLQHDGILTAEATEPEKAASDAYQTYARYYLDVLNDYKTSAPEHKQEAFETLVTSCESCHKTLCPGPLVRIKKLHL